jgi:predicted glycogen debranching enzyme
MESVVSTVAVEQGPTHQASDQPPGLDREWLLANGRGDFAMGSVAGPNTRRYHSLLTVAARPPVQRFNLFSHLAIELITPERSVQLATYEFAGHDGTVFHPEGWRVQTSFEKDLTARRYFAVDGLNICLTTRLRFGQPTTLIELTITPDHDPDQRSPDNLTVRLHPLLAMRDFHHLNDWLDTGQFRVAATDDPRELMIERNDVPRLYLAGDVGRLLRQPDVWRNFHYRADAARGQDHTEDLYTPGFFEHQFVRYRESVGPWRMRLAGSTSPIRFGQITGDDGRADHLRRIIRHATRGIDQGVAREAVERLCVAGDDFVVERQVDGQAFSSILAGYPWFADWGRDTMICLPGLLLCTGRHPEALATLNAYARHIRRGLVPNRFDDYGGQPHYNAVDASLWFIHAATQYVQASDDRDSWQQQLWPACDQIINGFAIGTDFDVRVDDDGLVTAGNPHTQLTWMDAKRDGVTFTPRHGKAVEINALWYNGLCACAGMIRAFDTERADQLENMAARVKRSFMKLFWSDELGYLIDHLAEGQADRSLRPNQVFAVSLPHSPLPRTKQRRIMQVVTDRLLTPMGLRTLPTDDPSYHGRYAGSMFERDQAYHQGTVWAWLIGPYVEGLLRANRFGQAARKQARQAVTPLIEELAEHSLGQLHEVFDGDPPHRPNGCMAQAWSVAELLRAVMLIETGTD